MNHMIKDVDVFHQTYFASRSSLAALAGALKFNVELPERSR